MLNYQQYVKWQDNVALCTRLYEGFADAAPFVNAVYECIYKFFEDYPVTPQPAVDPQDAADSLRAGKSLSVNPALDTKGVVELLKRISEALVKANPELKGTTKVLKEKLDHFLLNSPDKVSKEEMWHLCDSLVEETALEQDLATFL
ncbi:MAG TPA: hypothetical protein ENN57_02215, partial [Chloroflexi bacterium]|nr:hypothetical protein [Chloroflexota bacterium]